MPTMIAAKQLLCLLAGRRLLLCAAPIFFVSGLTHIAVIVLSLALAAAAGSNLPRHGGRGNRMPMHMLHSRSFQSNLTLGK